jgi:hypothetical protein
MNCYIELKNPEVIERRYLRGIKNLLTQKETQTFSE